MGGGLDVVGVLKEGGRGSVGSGRHRARSALVVAQIGMTVILLVGSGLMIRSFRELGRVPPGFELAHEIVTFRVTVPEEEIRSLGLGVAAGLAGSLAATRLMAAMLFGVGAFDPVTYAAVVVLLVALSLPASLLPALRASRIRPVEALRGE